VVALLGADTAAAKTEGAVTIAGNFVGAVKSLVESAIGEAGALHLTVSAKRPSSRAPELADGRSIRYYCIHFV
jgi:hypothetical protein